VNFFVPEQEFFGRHPVVLIREYTSRDGTLALEHVTALEAVDRRAEASPCTTRVGVVTPQEKRAGFQRSIASMPSRLPERAVPALRDVARVLRLRVVCARVVHDAGGAVPCAR
jgi:hypothetical protein